MYLKNLTNRALIFDHVPTNGQNLREFGGYQFQTLGETGWTDPAVVGCFFLFFSIFNIIYIY